MNLSDFDFTLPDSLIAQEPAAQRDQSRLLCANRETQTISHTTFDQIEGYFQPGDVLVRNNTKVMKARFIGRRQTGGRVEVFVERIINGHAAHVLAKANKPIAPNTEVYIGGSQEHVCVLTPHEEYGYWAHLTNAEDTWHVLMESHGRIPLPPYIKRDPQSDDEQRYQTSFAKELGAVAAPTAGLHVTPALTERLRAKGVEIIDITLHVGSGTFMPVKVEDIYQHKMHHEYVQISPNAWESVLKAKSQGRRVIALGTTSVRALESRARLAEESAFETDIFIYPGFSFQVVDALITNFHLPKSTLLMLVSALAGREFMLKAYKEAIEKQYRFFSYGDAMLIY